MEIFFLVATVLTACGMRRRMLAEEQSDDEIRIFLVSDRGENKGDEATVLTVCGMREGCEATEERR